MSNWLHTSAGRLYIILEEAQKYADDAPVDLSIGEVWISILEYEDTFAMRVQAHSQMLSLIYAIYDDLKIYSSSSADIQFYALDNIIQRFNVLSPSDDWRTLSEQINRPFLASLATLGNLLSAKKESTELTTVELGEIKNIVDDLLECITSSTINDDLKYHLVDLAKGLHDAIIYYRLYGVQGVEKAIERAIGTIGLNQHKATTAEEKNVLKEVFNFSLEIAKNIRTYYDILQITLHLLHVESDEPKSLN